MTTIKFPKDFYWGAATAAHQVEGGNHNDWSEWEKQNAERLARESKEKFGHLPNWKDIEAPALDPKNYISGQACDHYSRFREDFDIAKSLHHNAHRFSIEWSRIEPEENKFDEKAILHYREVLHALRERNIEPFVTLWHWTLPLWLANKGGTCAKDFPKHFEHYVEKVVTALGNDVIFWITLNEPDVQSAHAYFKGTWPPQKRNPFSYLHALYSLKIAHKKAYSVIKKKFPNAQVGIAKHQIYFEMARKTFINTILKSLADWFWNQHFLNLIKYEQDFIGLNFYKRCVIDNGFFKNPNKVLTDFGWEYSPESMYHALTELKPFGLPIYITENGIADASDELRQKFIPSTLEAVHRAIGDGADVQGYFYWSLLDNFEWDKGYWLRFGLVHIDYATQKRTIRESAIEYAKVCERNAVEIS